MRNSGKIIFAVMLLVSMLPLTSCGKSEAPGLSSGGVGGNEGGTSEEYKYPKPSQSAISSIFPSLVSDGVMCSFTHISYKILAASFS